MRIAAYLRYSTEMQSAASLADQLRNVRAYCERAGWPDPVVFEDRAISGSRADRPGYRRMLAEIAGFDALVVDDLTRLSRDSVEAQQQIKRLRFAGVRVVAISDGIDTAEKSHKLGVGLKGLMGELYLDDLRDRTHRGLTGRALAGASAGGLPYGYRVTEKGQRAIDETQADVVRRIYAEYLAGFTARDIAGRLNADGIPSGRGSTWCASAIHGDTRRGIGILANPVYMGRQVWNRSTWVKDPDTGRRLRRERPQSEWITTDLPELAIIPRQTWDAAQRRLTGRASPGVRGGQKSKHLLSGLLRCGECGGPLVVINRVQYGCARAKDRGTCSGSIRISRIDAERSMLAGLVGQLRSEEAFKTYQRAFVSELKKQQPSQEKARQSIAQAERERDNIMRAIRAGIITPTTKAELERSEGAISTAKAALSTTVQPICLPRLRERWERLANTLADKSRASSELREILQTIIGTATVQNANGAIVCTIAPSEIRLVAGAGFDRYLNEPMVIEPFAQKPARRCK